MEDLFTTSNLVSLLTLTLMEIVLGIDNVVFISIITSKVKKSEQPRARIMGLSLAMISRIGLLMTVSWLVHLTNPLFTIIGKEISIKDLILIGGGLFLMYKSITEIYNKVELRDEEQQARKELKFSSAIWQIIIIDIIFSLDSIITAVGLVDEIMMMIIAVIFSLGVMLVFSKAISNFVDSNPSIKVLALSFLIMIGTTLIAEGFHIHFPKGYIYFSMAFSLAIEFVNMRMRKRRDVLKLRSIRTKR